MDSDNLRPLLPITCRFVPYDQWFTTHVDDTWKVKQVKHWFLSKCNLIQEPDPPKTLRSVSPITFAASIPRSRSSLDASSKNTFEEDEYDDDSDDYDDFSHRHVAMRRQNLHSKHMLKSSFSSTASDTPSGSPSTTLGNNTLTDQYTLISFSTGIILEDDYALSWYNIHPYELFELHRAGTVVALSRDVIPEYVQPYFEAKVRAMRAVWSEKSGRFESPSNSKDYIVQSSKGKDKARPDPFMSLSTPLAEMKHRRAKIEWRDRWVVIHQGLLTICKDQTGNFPLYRFPLSASCALRGSDSLARACSIITEQRVVCIKFKPFVPSSPPVSMPASPVAEHPSMDHIRVAGNVDRSKGREKQQASVDTDTDGEVEDRNSPQPSLKPRPEDICRSEGEWLVLDLMEDHAFSSILRILHRQLPSPISSSFIPTSSIISMPAPQVLPPAITPFMYSYPYDSLPYPEWRTNMTETARKAGMGDIGKPMAWILWEEKGMGETLRDNIRKQRREFNREIQYRRSPIPPGAEIDDGFDTDDESELEWGGWMRDLDRQGRARQPETQFCRQESYHKDSGLRNASAEPTSSLPSPPLSETSSPDRGRSPILQTSCAASPKLSHNYLPHTLYSNLNTLVERPQTPSSREDVDMDQMTITTSTVTVGQPSRRRSSTMTNAVAAKLRKGGGAGSDTTHGSRSQGSVHERSIPRAIVNNRFIRHARSGSNLHMVSNALGPNEVTSDPEADTDNVTPVGAKKRHNGIMRGMSIQKFVRGLDSALEFVEGRS